jgi:murein DD-endopeptidase MepM/ murein hydrolase activator NlpD
MQKYLLLFALTGSLSLPQFSSAETSPIKITAQPAQIWSEKGNCGQYLNFDFVVENPTEENVNIIRVEVSVFDRAGKLELQKHLDGSGFSPSIWIVPNREIASKASILVFNPFFSFEADVDLARLRYEFSFATKDRKKEYKSEVEVGPKLYETKTNLILPLQERLIVNSGHDFFAHHRRFNYLHPIARQIGFTANFMRYAYDFFVINDAGKKFKTNGEKPEDWFGYGKNVFAPGPGKVIDAANDYPEDFGGKLLSGEKIENDRMLFYGNHVVIDHGNGEFSMLAHLQQGSIRVKNGELVKSGQLLAAVGVSGSAEEPHLHYELRSGVGFDVEGLPSYFTNFNRLLGAKSISIKRGRVDTGDIIASR